MLSCFDTPVVETHGIPVNWACLDSDELPNPAASHFKQAIPDCRSVHDSFSAIFFCYAY